MTSARLDEIEAKAYAAMDDDFNTPVVIAVLFELASLINKVNDGHESADAAAIARMKAIFDAFAGDILGLRLDTVGGEGDNANMKPFEDAVDLLLELRKGAKAEKNWAMSDLIRNKLSEIGFDVKDTKDGFEWSLKK